MQRASSPQAVGPADASVATHAPPLSVDDASPEALYGELSALAQGLRAHLQWLKEGGVTGLPRPQGPPVRRSAPAIAPEARTPEPPPAHAEVAEHDPMDGAEAMRRALEVSARAAGAYGPRSATAPSSVAPAARPLPPLPLPAPGAAFVEVPELVALRTGGQLAGAQGLQEVRTVLGDCQRCKLCHGRTNLVFGEGHAEPLLAFVGEGPGADEDRQGRPFVGAAGELLNKMIKAMANEAAKQGRPDLSARLSREQVYIANVVKCRPPGNRTPEPDEIAACGGFVRAQLRCLSPHVKVVVALGRTPTQFLLQTPAPISRLRGQFHRLNDPELPLPIMPTFHPAYLLRTESAKKQVWDDLKVVLQLLMTEVPAS